MRLWGPWLGLVPMVVIGTIAWVSLRSSESGTSGLVGLICGVTAAPGLLVAGAPVADDALYRAGVLASVPFWWLLGLLASRRATRLVIASWRDYWRELAYLVIAVAMGAVIALVIATAVLGESLIG